MNKSIAVYDIETPFITAEGVSAIDIIYCMAVTLIVNDVPQPTKIFTQYWTPYSDGSIAAGINLINTADIRCAHNGIGFDDIVLTNVYGIDLLPIPYDTLILSKIVFSKDELIAIDAELGLDKSLWGSYALKAFGKRLNNDKIEFEAFDTGLTEEMCIYCKQDTELTAQLIQFLMAKENFPIPAVIDIEHKAAAIIAEQTEMGFYLDIDKARALNTKLLQEKLTIANQLSEVFFPKFLQDGPVKEYTKQSTFKRYLPNPGYRPVW